MQRHGVRAKGKRRFKVTTDSNHNMPISSNLLNREFTVAEPDRVWVGEIVCTQMTKTNVLAARAGGNHITNLDFCVCHDDPVNQEFDQLALLREVGIRKSASHAGAEVINGNGKAGNLFMALGLRTELAFLLGQRMVALFQFPTPPLVLGQRDDAVQVGLRQTVQLLAQTGAAFAQVLATCLQFLRQPMAPVRPF